MSTCIVEGIRHKEQYLCQIRITPLAIDQEICCLGSQRTQAGLKVETSAPKRTLLPNVYIGRQFVSDRLNFQPVANGLELI